VTTENTQSLASIHKTRTVGSSAAFFADNMSSCLLRNFQINSVNI